MNLTHEEEAFVEEIARRAKVQKGVVLKVKTGKVTLSREEERRMDASCKKLGKGGADVINSRL